MAQSQFERSLYVIWQDVQSRRWLPVGRLSRDGGEFCFEYTRGALTSQIFEPFAGMKEKERKYRSEKLFPLFANRVISASRPEYPRVMRWLGLDEEWTDGFEVLARSGGQRKTDTLQLVPSPEKTTRNAYKVLFFGHGVRYLDDHCQERLLKFPEGERLYPVHDLQNPADPNAVLLRTGDPMSFAGYCPRYLAEDFLKLISASQDPANVVFSVERVNVDAPPQMRLLCKIEAPWPKSFKPFAADEFEPISRQDEEATEGSIAATG